MKLILIAFPFLLALHTSAQSADQFTASNIRTVKFNVYGNPLQYPIWNLNSGEQLELNFDDIDGNVRNYSYTYELRNADWSPAMLSQFDYIRGFSQVRISTYRLSSIALTKYTHYQSVLPERNSAPSRSGNYLLKVFLDGDPNKIVLSRRFLVVNKQVDVIAQIQQPFNGQYFKSHQKVQFSVTTGKLNMVNPIQQVSVSILQNDRWDNAINNIHPTFIRQGTLEYNTENCIFPAGREWRWLDLRSFRLQSDRVAKANYEKQSTEIFVRPDVDRSQQRFVFYRDNNGMFYNDVMESINPLWQGDYATVHFTYIPPANIAFKNKDVYVLGELTNYASADSAKMHFNEEKGVYETSLFLKQGYYDYGYATRDVNQANGILAEDFTEGNYWETENNYTILVYYRPLGGRADELISFTRINSLAGRQGLGF